MGQPRSGPPKPRGSDEKEEGGFCPKKEETPFMEPRTSKFRFCSLTNKSKGCPPGYTCQKSPILKKHICCGKSGRREVDGEENDGEPPGEMGKMVVSGGNGDNKKPTDVCDKGFPFMVNGVPQTCAGTVCPSNYHCTFSKSAGNYYCCSKDNFGSMLLYKIEFHPFYSTSWTPWLSYGKCPSISLHRESRSV